MRNLSVAWARPTQCESRARVLVAKIPFNREHEIHELRATIDVLERQLAEVVSRVARLQAKGAAEQPSIADNSFRLDGEVWTVRFAGKDLRLNDGKGPRYLATLLAAPAREIPVLAFVAPSASPTPWNVHEGLSVGTPGGSIEVGPDSRARREYRERLDDLRAELEEAESFADTGRAERLRAEIDQLASQLAECFGTRTAVCSPAETARKAVTKVLRTQIGKLLDMHPALGRHLRDTIRTGKVCVYAPSTPIAWEIGFGDRIAAEPAGEN